MTTRQRILRWVYPIWMKLAGNIERHKKIIQPRQKAKAPVAFHKLTAILNNGQPFDFASLKGKKVLIVNTASDCGYTAQYADLEKLWQQRKDTLTILAFPANDFKDQERGSDKDIASFCSMNYGITFPILRKTSVLKKNNPDPVFRWLTQPEANGWNNHYPDWNFSKYLVDEEGNLLAYFGPGIAPEDPRIIQILNL